MKSIQLAFAALLAVSSVAQAPVYSEPTREKVCSKISHLPHEPLIRVEMLSDVEGAVVEVKGSHNIYDPRTGKKLESAYAGSSYYMYPLVDGMKWGAEFPGVFQLLLVPDSQSTSIFLAGKQLKGMLACYQVEGTIGFVNELSVEDFVESLIGADVPQAIKEREALAALAIMLRTDALYQTRNPKNSKYWDVKAHSCGYNGYAFVRQDEPFVEAMKATKDMVLVSPTDNAAFGVEPILSFSKDAIARRADECEELAKQGKDAKAILNQLFPKARVALVKDLALQK
jgi:hypothetical protein